jgi:hypothetical protein
MDRPLAYQESLQDRITAGVAVMRIALEKQAPYLALATAREAARAALLALGQAPLRPGRRELALLREAASTTSHRFVGHPDDRQALVHATLDLLERLFPQPGMAEAGGENSRPGAVPAARRDANPGPPQPSATGGKPWQ